MTLTRTIEYSLPLKFATFYNSSESDVLDGHDLAKLLECDDQGELDLKYEEGTYAGKTFRVKVDQIFYEGKFSYDDDQSIINRRQMLSFSEYVKMGRRTEIIIKETLDINNKS